MRRELWYNEDLRQALLAARQPLLQAGVDGDFRRGYEAALVTLALAFGLNCAAIGLRPHLGFTVRVFDDGDPDDLLGDRVTATTADRASFPPRH